MLAGNLYARSSVQRVLTKPGDARNVRAAWEAWDSTPDIQIQQDHVLSLGHDYAKSNPGLTEHIP
eukprot:COSAG01_NODE_35_length_34814_cov_128.883624_17_plen_65_part_00